MDKLFSALINMLSKKFFVALALFFSFMLFGYSVLYPDPIRVLSASIFALLVFIPLVILISKD